MILSLTDVPESQVLRTRAINDKGISPPSNILKFHTDKYASLASSPDNIVIGQYLSDDTASIEWNRPVQDGGVHITTYTVEIDTTDNFNPMNSNYSILEFHEHHEQQEIIQYFRSADNVVTRGGVFTISLGGKSTAALAHDISAYDMEIALNQLFNTRKHFKLAT